MDLTPRELDSLVTIALTGDDDACVAFHERCEEVATARRVVAMLALKRNGDNASAVADWIQAIVDVHPNSDVCTR